MSMLKKKVEMLELKVQADREQLIQQKNIIVNHIKSPEFLLATLLSSFIIGLVLPSKKLNNFLTKNISLFFSLLKFQTLLR